MLTPFNRPLHFPDTLLTGILMLLLVLTASAQTKVVKTPQGYSLMRNGVPYPIKGVGGEVNLDKAVAIGANSIRTWGVDNAQQVLDEAQRRGLTVMLGLWLQHERHGFDYDDSVKVRKQFEYFKTVIAKFKNHPALLMWGVGNELDLNYSNTNVWYAVEDLARYIHQVDPDHPTATVTAGLDSAEVRLIRERAPDIDIYGVNTYGDISGVPQNITRYGWDGPYMITEWGPNGYWESPQTSWNVSVEQTSTQKKSVYSERYQKYIAPYTSHCLGSYAFLWGNKQEYTETWFGLFTAKNEPTEAIDALEAAFSDGRLSTSSPTIQRVTLNHKVAEDNIRLKAGERYPAEVESAIATGLTTIHADSGNVLTYEWKILAESDDKRSGGDLEAAAREVNGLSGRSSKSAMTFRAPAQQGAYRLFVYVKGFGKVAYANIPFWVEDRSPEDGPAHVVQFKRQTMDF